MKKYLVTGFAGSDLTYDTYEEALDRITRAARDYPGNTVTEEEPS